MVQCCDVWNLRNLSKITVMTYHKGGNLVSTIFEGWVGQILNLLQLQLPGMMSRHLPVPPCKQPCYLTLIFINPLFVEQNKQKERTKNQKCA